MPLTENQARNSKPRERAYKRADSEGLFLLVQPNGTRLWRLKYCFAGKARPRRNDFRFDPIKQLLGAMEVEHRGEG